MQAFNKWYRQLLRHPKYRWWVILGTLVYFFSPIDLSPDLLPLLGQIDDVLLLVLLGSGLWNWLQDSLKHAAVNHHNGEESASNQTVSGNSQNPVTIDVDATELDR
ncbi:DUF1232 domain-containing protein [Geitlerinema sp. PCC 9228]|jgi:uncharacterized membrane protein YkvA (DUF1232 family)|uniref:DUF1232 domain-containing protein n=1 Tax=Geitlerinema sp. PCC 9228 TaxID=111611 RepID=UPI0008F9E195|nr:DUF1232 domain-containing protein [Geitlerinema sp. PCC 9228]